MMGRLDVRRLFTLRGLLFALLTMLLVTVVGLLLALITTPTSPSSVEAGGARSPSATDEPPPALRSETEAPDAPRGGGAPLVRLPPRPQPVRLEALELLSPDAVNDPALRSFLLEADRIITALDPLTGYLGLLATQALRDETSKLRVLAESGGAVLALADVRPVRWTSDLPADAQTLALLLRSILVTSSAGQTTLLSSVAGQPAITVRIQQAREARALARFIEVQDALEFGADLRDRVVRAATSGVG